VPEHPLSEIKANLFKGLAHPARIRVLELLDEGGEVSVADLIAGTGLEASNLSQHLGVLRRYELVESDRQGAQVRYRLACCRVVRSISASSSRDTRSSSATRGEASRYRT
jgi:ArsR family transcriptional regulator